MEVSSTTGSVLQSIQGLAESPRQSSSTQQAQASPLDENPIGNTRGSNESAATNASDTQNESRAVNATADSGNVNDNERVGTLIDVQA